MDKHVEICMPHPSCRQLACPATQIRLQIAGDRFLQWLSAYSSTEWVHGCGAFISESCCRPNTEEQGQFICLNAQIALTRAVFKENFTALHLAAIEGHLNVARVLVDARADLEAMDLDSTNPRHVLCLETPYSAQRFSSSGRHQVTHYHTYSDKNADWLFLRPQDLLPHEKVTFRFRVGVRIRVGGGLGLRLG